MRTVILILVAAFPALATYPNGYSYRRTITVQAAQVPSTQTNFPMLISGTYSYLATVANGGKVEGTCNQTTIVISVGCDIIFTSDAAGSSVLDFEFETYSATTGAVNIWVEVPSIANGTVIYLFYGKSGVAAFQGNVNGVWDSNFKGVWHFPNGTSLTTSDSTSNAHNGSGVNSPTAVAGKIDGGVGLNGTTQTVDVTTTGALNPGTSSITIEAWGSPSGTSGFYSFMEKQTTSGSFPTYDLTISNTLFAGGNGKRLTAQFRESAGTLRQVYSNSDLTDGNMHHWAVSYTAGSAPILYFDGAAISVTTAGSGTPNIAPASNLIIGGTPGGGGFFNGTLDEVRLSIGAARSADWIAASYNNQNAPSSFYAVGSETVTGGAMLIMAQEKEDAHNHNHQRWLGAFLYAPYGTRKRGYENRLGAW
jgi:biopolymer transport protein ExbB